jgi:outer membrane protein insertion porin family
MSIPASTSRTLVFSTTNPYFTQDGISRTLDLYYRTDKPYEDQGGNYELVTTGAGIRVSGCPSVRPIPYSSAAAGADKIKPGTNIPAAYLAYADTYGFSSNSIPL